MCEVMSKKKCGMPAALYNTAGGRCSRTGWRCLRSYDLTQRQRKILHVLRDGNRQSLGAIQRAVDPDLPDSTLRDDLKMLRSLSLVRSAGWGRGADWQLEQAAAVAVITKVNAPRLVKKGRKTRNNGDQDPFSASARFSGGPKYGYLSQRGSRGSTDRGSCVACIQPDNAPRSLSSSLA